MEKIKTRELEHLKYPTDGGRVHASYGCACATLSARYLGSLTRARVGVVEEVISCSGGGSEKNRFECQRTDHGWFQQEGLLNRQQASQTG